MRKRPVLIQTGGKNQRQKIWEIIRKKRELFSSPDLIKATGIDDTAVFSYLKCLLAAGFIERITPDQIGIGETHLYKLIKDNGIEAPRLRADGSPVTIGANSQAIWRTIRILKRPFNPGEITSLASTETVIIKERSARTYLQRLRKAGYLELCPNPDPNSKSYIYRLKPTHDTGPRSPVLKTDGTVYDPNLDKIISIEEPGND